MNGKRLVIKKSNFLPHQYDFIKCDAEIKGLVAGYGSGKTYAFVKESVKQHIFSKSLKNGKSNGWIIYPTLELARDLFVDDFLEELENKKIKCEFSKHHMSFHTIYGKLKIYTLERPERMIGSSLTYIGIDEYDTSRLKNAQLAYKKILARMRGSDNAQLFIVTTPEGFGATYNIFVENASPNKKLFHAKTMDNPYLPKRYIERMRETYDSKLLQAYLEGKFVNLNSGVVYYGFSKDADIDHRNSLEIDFSVPLRIYFDFNVSPFIIGYGQHKDKSDIRAIGEITMKGHSDTESACQALIDEVPRNLDVVIYGDAAGTWTGTKSKVSDYEIIDRVFRPYFKSVKYKVPRANPGVRNRINAVNARLSRRAVKINAKCVSLTKDCEQVCYAANGKDIDKSNLVLTHATDGWGYYINTEFPVLKPSHNHETRSWR